jgi:MoxR-like ATPase
MSSSRAIPNRMNRIELNNQVPISTELVARLEQSIQSVIRGKDEVIRLALVTLFARGHLLVDDVPGVG